MPPNRVDETWHEEAKPKYYLKCKVALRDRLAGAYVSAGGANQFVRHCSPLGGGTEVRRVLCGLTCSLRGAEIASEVCWRSVPLEAFVRVD